MGHGGPKSPSGVQRQSPGTGSGVFRSPEAETIVNAALIKIVKFVLGPRSVAVPKIKSYCTHDIFSEIRTAHLEISATHFVLQNTLF